MADERLVIQYVAEYVDRGVNRHLRDIRRVGDAIERVGKTNTNTGRSAEESGRKMQRAYLGATPQVDKLIKSLDRYHRLERQGNTLSAQQHRNWADRIRQFKEASIAIDRTSGSIGTLSGVTTKFRTDADRVSDSFQDFRKGVGEAAEDAEKLVKGINNAAGAAGNGGRALRRIGKDAHDGGSNFSFVTRQMQRLNNAMRLSTRDLRVFQLTLGLLTLPALITVVGVATQALTALSAGVIALTSAIAPLAAGVAALPVLFLTAKQAVGTFKLAFYGMDKIITSAFLKPFDDFQTQIQKFTPAARNFAVQIRSEFHDVFLRTQQTAQTNIFSGILDAMQDIRKFSPSIQRIVNDTSNLLGGFARRAGSLAAQPQFLDALNRLGNDNLRWIDRLGSAVANLADGFRAVLLSAEPLVDFLTDMTQHASALVHIWLKNAEGTGRLARMMDDARATLDQLVHIAVNLGKALVGIGRAAAPLGKELLDSLQAVTKEWADWTNSVRGQIELRDYFMRAKPAIVETAKLLGDIAGGLARLGAQPGLAKLINQIRTQLGPEVGTLLRGLTQDFGPALINLFTKFVGLLATVSRDASPLVILVDTFAKMLDVLTKIVNKAPFVEELLIAFLSFSAAIRAIKLFSLITGLTAVIGAVTKWREKLDQVGASQARVNALTSQGNKLQGEQALAGALNNTPGTILGRNQGTLNRRGRIADALGGRLQLTTPRLFGALGVGLVGSQLLNSLPVSKRVHTVGQSAIAGATIGAGFGGVPGAVVGGAAGALVGLALSAKNSTSSLDRFKQTMDTVSTNANRAAAALGYLQRERPRAQVDVKQAELTLRQERKELTRMLNLTPQQRARQGVTAETIEQQNINVTQAELSLGDARKRLNDITKETIRQQNDLDKARITGIQALEKTSSDQRASLDKVFLGISDAQKRIRTANQKGIADPLDVIKLKEFKDQIPDIVGPWRDAVKEMEKDAGPFQKMWLEAALAIQEETRKIPTTADIRARVDTTGLDRGIGVIDRWIKRKDFKTITISLTSDGSKVTITSDGKTVQSTPSTSYKSLPPGFSVTAPLQRAMGGYVPGAPVAADTVPALLSPGEFVVTGHGEQIIDQATGVPGFLNWLAGAQMPHFNTGGRIQKFAKGGRPNPEIRKDNPYGKPPWFLPGKMTEVSPLYWEWDAGASGWKRGTVLKEPDGSKIVAGYPPPEGSLVAFTQGQKYRAAHKITGVPTPGQSIFPQEQPGTQKPKTPDDGRTDRNANGYLRRDFDKFHLGKYDYDAPLGKILKSYFFPPQLNYYQLAGAAKDAGFRDDRLITATAVGAAESSRNVHAYNIMRLKENRRMVAHTGLWQIQWPSHAESHLYPKSGDAKSFQSWVNLFEPKQNATAAYKLSNEGTKWSPWEGYTNKSYLDFIQPATVAARAITKNPNLSLLPPTLTGNPKAGKQVQPKGRPLRKFTRPIPGQARAAYEASFLAGVSAGENLQTYNDILPGLIERGSANLKVKTKSDQTVTPGTEGTIPGGIKGPAKTLLYRMQVEAAKINNAHLPYSFGGGHPTNGVPSLALPGHPNSFTHKRMVGLDCSSTVSRVLMAAGLLGGVVGTGGLAEWGQPGKGKNMTVYVRNGGTGGGHTFMKLLGLYFGTSGQNKANYGGPAYMKHSPGTAGFAARHWPGLRRGGRIGPQRFAKGGRPKLEGLSTPTFGAARNKILPDKGATGRRGPHKPDRPKGFVSRVRQAASTIAQQKWPYAWNGGHTSTPATPSPGWNDYLQKNVVGYDCSGAVSAVLQRSGVNVPTMGSGDYMGWGKAGVGKQVTLYTNPEHIFMQIGNGFWGTSAQNAKRNAGGPGWITNPGTGGFVARHPQGFAKGGRVKSAQYYQDHPDEIKVPKFVGSKKWDDIYWDIYSDKPSYPPPKVLSEMTHQGAEMRVTGFYQATERWQKRMRDAYAAWRESPDGLKFQAQRVMIDAKKADASMTPAERSHSKMFVKDALPGLAKATAPIRKRAGGRIGGIVRRFRAGGDVQAGPTYRPTSGATGARAGASAGLLAGGVGAAINDTRRDERGNQDFREALITLNARAKEASLNALFSTQRGLEKAIADAQKAYQAAGNDTAAKQKIALHLKRLRASEQLLGYEAGRRIGALSEQLSEHANQRTRLQGSFERKIRREDIDPNSLQGLDVRSDFLKNTQQSLQADRKTILKQLDIARRAHAPAAFIKQLQDSLRGLNDDIAEIGTQIIENVRDQAKAAAQQAVDQAVSGGDLLGAIQHFKRTPKPEAILQRANYTKNTRIPALIKQFNTKYKTNFPEDISAIPTIIAFIQSHPDIFAGLDVPRFAQGGMIKPTKGGTPIIVGEGGFNEVVLTTDPKHRDRTDKILSNFMKRTGRAAAAGWETEQGNTVWGGVPQITIVVEPPQTVIGRGIDNYPDTPTGEQWNPYPQIPVGTDSSHIPEYGGPVPNPYINPLPVDPLGELTKDAKGAAEGLTGIIEAAGDYQDALYDYANALVDLAEAGISRQNEGLRHLELVQKLGGSYDTGGAARADFITKNIIPAIQGEIDALGKAKDEADRQGDKELAQQIADSIAAKQNDILEEQLQAQQEIAANTRPRTGGSLSFEYGGQQFTDVIGAGVGA